MCQACVPGYTHIGTVARPAAWSDERPPRGMTGNSLMLMSGCLKAGRADSGEDASMSPRPLTDRERAVLTAILAVDFAGVERFRAQAAGSLVFGGCACGRPSIDFFEGQNTGMTVVVNGEVKDSGTYDGLFLFTVHLPDSAGVLGGIEWVGQSDSNPEELPEPERLTIRAAGP